MQLDILGILTAGGVPAEVITAAGDARKLEVDLHILEQAGQPGSVFIVDNLCVIGQGVHGVNWNRDDGAILIEYHED